jgi:hypothetical protein
MTAGRMFHARERERKLKHKVRGSPHDYVPSDAMLTQYCPEPNKSILIARGGRPCSGGRAIQPEPNQDEIDDRWHRAQCKLRNLPCFNCEWFLDNLPGLSCTYGGKKRSMISLPTSEEVADACPYSGKKEAIAKR